MSTKHNCRLAHSAPLLLLSAAMRYRFANCDLDDQLYQLKREGASVEIEPKVFDVLAYLLHNRDRVVSKDELLEKLWPGQVVTETALTRCIVAARKAVGDDGTRQQVIETQHGRGYRFVASLATTPLFSLESKVQSLESENHTSLPEAAHAPDPRRQTLGAPALSAQRSWSSRSFVLGGLVVLVGLIVAVQYLSRSSLSTQDSASSTAMPQELPFPDKPSIVVLPFTNMSEDPKQEYFSDGITEDLTSSLSRIPSLFVIARQSAFSYKGKAVKVQEVSKEMGVRYVLEGSVRRADDRVRVTAQLIDGTTGGHLWSERYDRLFTDIFAVQDGITQKIATTLKLQLTLQEQGYIVHKRTDNLEAYDTLLRGIESFWHLTKEANAQARQLFEKALVLDPQYAEACMWLGRTYYQEWLYHWSTDPQKDLERTLTLAQQALALDDSLPTVHLLLSRVYARQRQQYDQALAESERAIALDPNNADSYAEQGFVLILAGRPEEAVRAVQHAMRLHPCYPHVYEHHLGWAYYVAGQYAEAVTTLKEAISRNPHDLSPYGNLAGSYLAQWAFQQSPDARTLEQALATAQQTVSLNGSFPWGHLLLGAVYLWQKQYDQVVSEMERAIALDPNVAKGYTGLAVTLGCMGKPAEALQMVEQALRRKPVVVDLNLADIGAAYALAGRPEEAIASLRQFLSRYPNILGAHLVLARVYSELGKEAEARTEAAEVLRLSPKFSLEVLKERAPIKDPALLERHIAALRKAGLK